MPPPLFTQLFCTCSHQQLPILSYPPPYPSPTPPPQSFSTLKGKEKKRKREKGTNKYHHNPPRGRRLSAYPGLDDKQIIIYRHPQKIKVTKKK